LRGGLLFERGLKRGELKWGELKWGEFECGELR
jgi:hypothetical protein